MARSSAISAGGSSRSDPGADHGLGVGVEEVWVVGALRDVAPQLRCIVREPHVDRSLREQALAEGGGPDRGDGVGGLMVGRLGRSLDTPCIPEPRSPGHRVSTS